MNYNLKEYIKNAMTFFSIYKKWRKKAKNNVCDKTTLEKSVLSAIKNVPYYKDYSKYLTKPFDIKQIPIIRKNDIVGKEELIINKNRWKFLLNRIETGGSTGVSLSLANSFFENIKKKAFTDHVWSILGNDLLIGELRGRKPINGISQKISSNRILLSSYLLNANTLEEYIALFDKNKINCIHAYPSSLVVLARLIRNRYGVSPIKNLKGIVTSSEIFSREDKMFVKKIFQDVKLVDLYGHNEMACLAICIENGNYEFFQNFGYTEFVDTGETINGNKIAEIVATSIMNKTMPLIRYATDDYVEIDKNNNIVSIIGRTSDFVVNKMKDITPCIVCTRTESMANVNNFQYYQEKEGKLTFRIVVNEKHNEHERLLLLEDMQTTFHDTMDCEVVIVEEIERTRAGKQKRLIQELDINKYKA